MTGAATRAMAPPSARPVAPRVARPRTYLMCAPTCFEVDYAINPWMDPAVPVDRGLALRQWERLVHVLGELGHTVEQIEPLAGLPDMVYAANGGTVIDGRVLGARFSKAERAAEGPAYLDWFRERGYPELRDAEQINEGEGDILLCGERILGGTGFRSRTEGLAEAEKFFGRALTVLELVDPWFYHLDTALAVLDDDEIMYYPAAFSESSRRTLELLYPDAILADDADAAAFGLNAIADGRHVILSAAATGLAARLRERGYEPIGIDLSELLKGGGGAKCCVLELRART